MSSISVPPFSSAPNIQPKPAQSAASVTSHSVQTAPQHRQLPTADLTDGPTDIIVTSPEATTALGTLNAQLSLGNTQDQAEAQKEFDAKQLKAALQQLHLLQLLGIGLGPEKLAKETTDLAKQIAGIAKDYADNSGSPQPGAIASTPSAATLATSAADTAAAQANSAASTQTTGIGATSPTGTDADQASKTAKAVADAAAQSTQSDAKTVPSAPGAANTPEASGPTGNTASASTVSDPGSVPGQSAASDPDKAAADNPDDFFAEVTSAFKDLKKIETRALSQLNLSPDRTKKDEAKKLGGEFNQAVLSAAQSASASGVSGAEIADQTIDLSKVTLNISV